MTITMTTTMATSAPVTATTTADFWFDPRCPWAWMASRWMLQVEQVRDVRVRWHVMSLSVLNEGQDVDPGYRAFCDASWQPVRALVAAQRDHGDDVVLPLYTALGNRFHLQDRDDVDAVVREALAEIGLPDALADLATTDAVDDALRSSHGEAIALVGQDVGTPVISVPGPAGDQVAFFGPVVTPAPKGEAAGRLWDGTLLVAGTPGFFELKRTRDVDPVFD